MIDVHDRRPIFRRQQNLAPYRILTLLVLLLASIFLLRAVNSGEIKPLMAATAVPTRVPASFALEGETHFTSGNLEKAILSYQEATRLDPQNVEIWGELARIQAYSSALLTTDEEQRDRLQDALASIDAALKIAPESSMVRAVRAFVLDWNASNPLVDPAKAESLLLDAEQEAVRAIQIDPKNALALAYYAEILVDQRKWLQAEQYIRQAVQSDDSLMDVHRVNAYVLESLGNYPQAIEEYKKASEVTPNLTFLYIRIGANYRQLKQYDNALIYYEKAVRINQNLGVKDPIPYLAIAKTYSQTGDFFVAARNVKRALQYRPNSPDVYGQLGMIYFKSRNYEGSMPAFQCAIYGCDAEKSCEVRECDPETDPQIEIKGMPLSPNTVVYYYTYGSALAGMHRKTDDKCTEAVKILGQVRDGFSGDPIILAIIKPSEEICASFGITR